MQATGTHAWLACFRCSWHASLANLYSCPNCGGSLDARYPIPTRGWVGTGQGVWRYRSLLPVAADVAPITMNEGRTPLLPALHLTDSTPLWLKNETVNPTASFKDRPVAVATTMAREFGLSGVICASTGNTAVSVAAYAARAGFPAVCLVPRATSRAKLMQILAAGARVTRVSGTYSDAYRLAQEAAERYGWANLTSTYINPYMLEGDKTVGYELFEQLNGDVPDWVVVPIGAGPLLAAIYKAFEELRGHGLLRDTCPRMVGVQAAGCAPIARAFETGAEEVHEWEGSCETRASSIADPLRGYAADGTRTLSVIRRSHGVAVAVSEKAIQDAMIHLARCEGLFVEPGAAATLAGYQELRRRGLLRSGGTVVLLLTGHGLKDVDALQAIAALQSVEETPMVEPGDIEALRNVLEGERHG